MATKQKVRILGYKGGAKYMNGTYIVSHDGRQMSIMPESWLGNDKVSLLKRRMYPKGVQNINIRHVVFQKLGIEMSAGGSMFVPIEYTQRTGRKTFRGMSFKEIRAAQRKY